MRSVRGMLPVIVTSGLIFSLYHPCMARDGVKVFSLQKPGKEARQGPRELNYPYIYGLSWRYRWSDIEPQEGQYHWDRIDRALEMTSNAGKKVMLRVIAGINSPEWVYQAGAKPFEFSNQDLAHPDNYRASLRMPIPWDDVYLAKWERFIHAFGGRYNGNPHVYSVHMSGGGYIGEMNLPKALEKWQLVGYSDQKLIATWKRLIDNYRKAFPDIPTNLALNEPLGRNRSNVLEPIVSYVLSTYPRQVYLQHNGLKANLPMGFRIRHLLRDASSQTVVGYQMVGGRGWLDQQAGNRMEAFRIAIEDHARYVEVYASDVRDPKLKGALEFLAAR